MPEPTVDLVAALRRGAADIEGEACLSVPCIGGATCARCRQAPSYARALRDLAEKVEAWRAAYAEWNALDGPQRRGERTHRVAGARFDEAYRVLMDLLRGRGA